MIGVMGGTFDPIHNGHLRITEEVREQLGLRRVHFIPCHIPPHRGRPVVDSGLRKEMVASAIMGNTHYVLDERELRREGPSYMVDTMASLRDEVGDEPIVLIMGADAFLGFDRWHRWQALLELCHLVITCRPGWQLDNYAHSPALDQLLRERGVTDADALRGVSGGKVLMVPVTQLDISSSAIRTALAEKGSVRYLLPEPVLQIIEGNGLYGG